MQGHRTARLRLPCLLLAMAVALGRPGAALDLKRQLLVHPKPDYPELARKMHVVGCVVIQIKILPDGHVAETVVKSGHPLLRQSARQAVAGWRYTPAVETTESVVEVVFQLGDE